MAYEHLKQLEGLQRSAYQRRTPVTNALMKVIAITFYGWCTWVMLIEPLL